MSFDVSVELALGDRRIACELASDARLTALVGPSGVGKSSVLNAIAGLLRPVAGRVRVDDRTLFDAATGCDLRPEQRRAGYVFQDARLFPHKRVAGNLAFAEKMAQPGVPLVRRDEIADMLEIGGLMDRWPPTLSGGEVRRVAIARALLSNPRFLLLDEPLASLDGERAARLIALIERIRDTLPVPILLVSHSPAEVERLAGHVVSMA